MNYINTQTLDYPISEYQIKQEFPNTSFPMPFVPPDGYAEVLKTDIPVFNKYTQSVVEQTPELINGQWRKKWQIIDLPQSECDAKLQLARSNRWEEIKNIRDNKNQNGGFPAAGKWFHSDTFSRSQYLGMVLAGETLPAILWKTMDGSFVETTPALAQQIFSSAFIQDTNMFAYAESLKAQVYASLDPNSIDITTGWPETYE